MPDHPGEAGPHAELPGQGVDGMVNHLYRELCACSRIFTLSRGATLVLAAMPASPPARKDFPTISGVSLSPPPPPPPILGTG